MDDDGFDAAPALVSLPRMRDNDVLNCKRKLGSRTSAVPLTGCRIACP